MVWESGKKMKINILLMFGNLSHNEAEEVMLKMKEQGCSIWEEMACNFTLCYGLEEMRFL
jgi:hypothetical protein